MQTFIKEIAVGTEKRKFEFKLLKNVNGEKFFITSTDGRNKPISFSLIQKDADVWKLTPGSLRWLYDIESDLANAIIDTRLQ